MSIVHKDFTAAEQELRNLRQRLAASEARSQRYEIAFKHLSTGFFILHITGVAVVDTQVAHVFIRAAQAVKLLGAQVILTGIRPEVAQTLIGLGVDLNGIITRGTPQSGITEALRGTAARQR